MFATARRIILYAVVAEDYSSLCLCRVGVAVTPVVCYFSQDLAEVDLKPNADEVAEVFTIPLASLLDRSQWVYKEDHAPIFIGGPYIIWGLTGFLLERFWKDVLLPFQHSSTTDPQYSHHHL